MTADHIGELITTGIAALSGIASYLRSRANSAQIDAVQKQVVEVAVTVDGRLQQLLQAKEEAGHARGLQEGITSLDQKQVELQALALRAAELQADALKAEAVRVAAALKAADQKADELRSEVQSPGTVNVTGSPVIVRDAGKES
jgi:hypothetical protein